jgi:hypothetical protein
MPAQAFPLDRLWIAPTNRLAMEINNRTQNWRSTEARHLDIIKSINQLITPTRTRPGLSECHQIDFVQKVEAYEL